MWAGGGRMNKISLSKKDKEKYKNMGIEEIIDDINSRGYYRRQEVTDVAKWIMEECK